MAENQRAEALRRNIAFIQESMAAGGLSTIAGHLLQLDLITRQNYRDSLAPCGKGPDDQAAMLMTSVEVRIRDNPDVYFTKFLEALRRSHLGNVADRLVQALPENQRHSLTSYNMITSNVPSPSGSTQTTATSHNQLSSFSNQPSSRYPVPPNVLPYNSFSSYFLPLQQPVLQPSCPQAYLSSYPYTLQQGDDPTHAHVTPDFSSSPNPVHLNQQYSVLPSHTNTPILHQNSSLSYGQHPLPSHPSGPPYLYHHRPRSQPFPLYSSTDPNSVTTAAATATSHHSNPPDVHSLANQFSRMKTSSKKTKTPKHTQSDSTRRPSSSSYHTKQSSLQKSFSHHSRQSHTSIHDSTIPARHSLAPPSLPTTTPSGVTASPSTPAYHLSPAMERYVSYLKNVYKNKTTPVYDKEHSLLQVKAKSFINIALVHKQTPQYMNDSDRNEMIMDRLHGHVDAIQETKTKLSICDVCKNLKGDLARSVLVEGAPGVGKTTFVYELCKRWAKGEILWEWAAVVLIKLRDHTTRTAQNMYDLLYHPRPEVQKAVVDELIDHDGEYLLLILDGYDELTDSQKESTSVIQRIMSKELLVQSTLMVTSRPLATRTLHDNFVQSIDQHIEVLGFTEKNIEEYIQSACGDKPELVEDFKSYLSSHPFSSALMFNPLQCAIVTDMYRSHWEIGDKGFAPKTLTELYTGLVHIMLLRYLTQHPVYKQRDWSIVNFSDLPVEVSQQLKAVTELAAKGIKNQQYVFDEVNTNIPSETFGLMQKEEVVASGRGISTSHNFLHLTLQEYLAAVNYSQQCSSPEQLSELLTRDNLVNEFIYCYKLRREPKFYLSYTHWPVVLFVAGRTKLSGVPTNIFQTGFHDGDDYDVYITIVDVSLLHLLYETQSPQLIQSTLVTSRKYLSVSGSNALDWFVIGYCIANSTSTWRVVIDSYDIPMLQYLAIDQLVMGLCLGPEECSGESKICSLHIRGYWAENLRIMLQLQQFTKKVTEINFVDNERWEQCDPEEIERKLLSEKLSACYPMLEELTIENAESSYSASLLSFISQHSNLHILSLNQCNLSSIATSSLIHFLQSPNNRLHELILYHCTIQIPGHTNSVAISNYHLHSPISNEKISLSISGSCSVINYMLSQPHQFYAKTLTFLELYIVSDTTDSLQIETSLYLNLKKLSIISKELENHTYKLFPFSNPFSSLRISSLERCTCYLTCDTIRSLIHSLQSSHCGLKELKLHGCSPENTKTSSNLIFLESLDSGNVSLEFTGHCCDISHWLSQLSSYTKLTELILHLERQDSTTADTLQILLHHHILESLKIENDDFALFISQFIGPEQNNLHTLSLSGCNLSSDVIRSFLHFLQSPHCMLRQLELDRCTIFIHDDAQQKNTYAISTKNNTTLCSLVTTDSLCVLNHILSNVLFTQMKEISLCITKHSSSAAELKVLTKIPVSCPVLETMKIDSSVSLSFPLSIPQFIGSQQNLLHTLSLNGCNLSSDGTRSFLHFLQSPHCMLHKLELNRCTISIHDDAQQKNTISTKNNTTLCSLVTTDSLSVLNHILSNVLFTQMTEISLCITTHDSSEAEVLTKIPVSCPVLETIEIDSDDSLSLPLSIPRLIGSPQNNLLTLSLSMCTLSSDVTRSLIHSMQSLHCKLQNLALKRRCTISLPKDAQQTTILMKKNVALHSLDISWSVLDQMMSFINPFTQSLTEMILHVDTYTHKFTSEVKEMLWKIPSNCPLLETLKIDRSFSLPLSIPRFIRSQQNNLHILSMSMCTLSSDVTKSFIQSLKSPHCKLFKLALCNCKIPTTDRTELTTAIVSSTTITDLLFIDRNVTDTPSLTALASGLKHNTTIEQLAVGGFYEEFMENQLKVLRNAVDSSAVKKLWLYYYASDYEYYDQDYIVCDSTLFENSSSVDSKCCWSCDDLFHMW